MTQLFKFVTNVNRELVRIENTAANLIKKSDLFTS